MRTVIGLAGVKTSGKSTAANIIKSILKEQSVVESALADKLKNVCSEVFDISRENFDKQDLKEVLFKQSKTLTYDKVCSILKAFGIDSPNVIDSLTIRESLIGKNLDSPRQIAQIVGTELLRQAGGENIHCKNVELGDNVTIISDIRFENEFNYFNNLRDTYFLPFYIQRDDAEKQITPESHSSETSVFTFCQKCIKLNNNNDISFLEKQIKLHLYCVGRFKLTV